MGENKNLLPSAAEKNDLYKAILALSDEKECEDFFEDICTINELKLICQRLQVAKLLKKGTTFNEIVRLTGASTATISRVNRALLYGAGSYSKIIEQLEKDDK